MAVKLRRPATTPTSNGDVPEVPQTITLPQLAISAVVVSKEAMIAAMRVFAPVTDIEVDDTGTRFILTIETQAQASPGASSS